MAKPRNPPPKPQRGRGVGPHENEATAQALLSLLLHAEELRSSLKEADIDPSEGVSIEELVARLAGNFLTGVGDVPYRQLDLEDKATIFRAQLDLIQRQIRGSPELRTEFERHSLSREKKRSRKVLNDQVAKEIAAEVTMTWSDRKQAPYKDQHWAWLKRPDLFVVHVFQKWIRDGRLRFEHLAHDEQLQDAYRTMVRRHPQRDIFPKAKGASRTQRP